MSMKASTARKEEDETSCSDRDESAWGTRKVPFYAGSAKCPRCAQGLAFGARELNEAPIDSTGSQPIYWLTWRSSLSLPSP